MYPVAKRFKINKSINSFQLTDRDNCGSPFADDIPADIFLKIFDYLDLEDICRAGRVCVRWYRLIREGYVWNRTDILSLNLPQGKVQKLLASLPQSVKHLRIGFPSNSTRLPMNLPELCSQITERCPELCCLIIENSLVRRLDVDYVSKSGYVLNCKTPVQNQVNKWFLVIKYAPDDAVPDGKLLPLWYCFHTLTVLSFRFSVFAVDDIFPRENTNMSKSKIKVLDLSHCLSTIDKNIVAFCRLPNLKELYLSGTAVTINGVLVILKNLGCLEILDLDDTVVGGETFSVLKRHGGKLVDIYMAGTAIKDEHLIDINASCFPNLRKICLRRTYVTQIGIDKLVNSLPSLKHVLVSDACSCCEDIPRWSIHQSVHVRENLTDNETEQVRYCNHFLENTYNGDFKKGKFKHDIEQGA